MHLRPIITPLKARQTSACMRAPAPFKRACDAGSRLGWMTTGATGLLLCLSVTTAHADWTFLAVKDGVTHMVDRSTIANAGPYKRIWMLQNYPMPIAYGVQSIAMLMEVECPKYRVRFNQMLAYAGQSRTGTLLETISQPGPWEGISPGPFRSVFDLLCRTNDPRYDTSVVKP
jgi:hypothetical protein